MSTSLRPVGRGGPTQGESLQERIRSAAAGFGAPSGGPVPRTSALLLDISASMGEHIGANRRKVDELRKLADGFTDVRRFQFDSTCEELSPKEKIAEPRGGTALHVAFAEVKRWGVKHVVLVTDGHPDSAGAALAEAAGLKIDCFYVGPDPAPDFLRKLAQQSGGKYGKASLDALKELQCAVRGLLPSGAINL